MITKKSRAPETVPQFEVGTRRLAAREGYQLPVDCSSQSPPHGTTMSVTQHENLFRRHPQNPILTAADWPYGINSVFNAAATLLQDGTTLLLCRVEDRRGHSHLCAARSQNGIDGWQIDPTPTLMPDPENYPEELWGIEDPRITYVPELAKYVVVYTAFSSSGPCVSLAVTEDFRTFERYGDIMPPEDKDAALLPHRIGDYWALIHRPVSGNLGANIWLSYSPDLRHWGSHRVILEARRGAWWDANKIGLSPPPIETEKGWLFLYHGVRRTAAGCLYRLGLALFDLRTPERCLRRGDSWIFNPEASYERFGDVDNVVFPCGYTIAKDGDTINLYYGGADSCIALATGSIRGLLAWLEKDGKPDNASKE
jgi:beta-1,2-mannobiose phosphorylase / 1,2-beta-oligomannan phosphorylase